jgi:predicted Zn-ribbon and HTH transcriptional regulator
MSISMEPFASQGHFATYDPFSKGGDRVAIFTIACRSCGFEPAGTVIAPHVCPKCHGTGWERFARPGSILENANRD